ncbi:MAG: energy transducer TonB [Gemmatimonadaceae bacterium]
MPSAIHYAILCAVTLTAACSSARPKPNVNASSARFLDPDSIVVVVHEAVRPVRATGSPRYPDTPRQRGVEGAVVVAFVVDTLGRPEQRTATVLLADPELEFVLAVCTWLRTAQFEPVLIDGRRRRALVAVPFGFGINGVRHVDSAPYERQLRVRPVVATAAALEKMRHCS